MEILAPYRKRIDELDDRIVDLLAARTEIIRQVAAVKFDAAIAATLPDRVEEVRNRAAARAAEKGLDPDLVRRLYTILIDYSCNLEEIIMDDLRAQQTDKKAAG